MRRPDRLIVVVCLAMAALASACASPREPSKTPRTAVEQLLLSQAVSRTLGDITLPITSGSTVALEVGGFWNDRMPIGTETDSSKSTPVTATQVPTDVYAPSGDLAFVRDMLAGRLGEQGLLIRRAGQDATYRVRVLVYGFGTEQGESLFGMPPVQSTLLPFSLPELTLFKKQEQQAYIRYSVDLYDARTGKLLASTPWYRGTSYYNYYTMFFFFSFIRSDLPFPPE
jgi:hypothetical protein